MYVSAAEGAFASKIDEITNAKHHKIISDLLASGKWQEAAKAALLAHYCRDQPADVFQRILGAKFGEVGEMILQQTTTGFFFADNKDLRDEVAFYIRMGQRTPPEMLYQDYRTDLAREMNVAGNLWIMNPATWARFCKRNVRTPHSLAAPKDTEVINTDSLACGPWAAYLVGGESGSGKTWHVLSSLPPFSPSASHFFCKSNLMAGFYMVASELTAFDEQNSMKTVVEAVMKVMKARLPGPTAQLLFEVDLLVVAVDECGDSPELIRSLVSTRFSLKSDINEWIDKAARHLAKEKKERRVQFIFVGTDVDKRNSPTGSMPSDYKIVRMPPCTNFYDMAWPRAGRSALQHAVAGNVRAKNMQGNRRLAALIVNAVDGVEKSVPSASIDSLVPTVLHAAAQTFKAKGGFANMSVEEIDRLFLKALRFAMNVSVCVDGKDRLQLCGELGVLTDMAEWKRYFTSEETSEWCVLEQGHETSLAYNKRLPRYRVTPAHMELLAARFGRGPIPPSMTSFDAAVGYFVGLALHACNGGSVQDLFGVFGPRRFEPAKSDLSTVPGEKLAYSGVTLVQLKETLDSKGSADRAVPTSKPSTDSAEGPSWWYDQKEAAVVLNGPDAAIADVMALVPGLGLLLVQCKRCDAATPLSEREALAGLFKMGLDEPATAIAHFAENVDWPYLESDAFTKRDATVPAELKKLLSSRRTGVVPRDEIFSALTAAQAESSLGRTKVAVACVEAYGRKYAASREGAVQQLLSKTTGGRRVVRILATTQDPIAALADMQDVIQLKVSATSLYPVPVPDAWQASPSTVGVVKL